MAPTKDKDRVYIQFLHRDSRSGYHWEIVLAPANEQLHAKVFIFDVSNSINTASEPRKSKISVTSQDWVYRNRLTDSLEQGNTICRILLTKVVPHPQLVDRLDRIFQAMPITQDDTTFTCRRWVKDAMSRLREEGFTDVPEPTEEFEAHAVSYANAVRGRMSGKNAKLVFNKPKDIYILDLRTSSAEADDMRDIVVLNH